MAKTSGGRAASSGEILPKIAGCAIALLGVMVLVGWFARVQPLVQVFPGFAVMQVNTAMGFALGGAGLLALQVGWRVAAGVCALAIVLIGGLTLVEHGTGVDLGIDALILPPFMSDSFSPPGRTSAVSSLAFLLMGGALLVLALKLPAQWLLTVAGSMGAAVIAFSLLGLTGHLSALLLGPGMNYLRGMAVHTSAGFFIAGLGVAFQVWSQVGPAFRVPSTAVSGSTPGSHRMWSLVVLSFALILACIGVLTVRLNEADQADRRMTQNLEAMLSLERVERLLDLFAADGMRVAASDTPSGEQIAAAVSSAQQALARAQGQTGGDAAQRERLATIARLFSTLPGQQIAMGRLSAAKGTGQAPQLEQLRADLYLAIESEVAALQESRRDDARMRLWITITVIACLGVATLASLALFFVARRLDSHREALAAQVHRAETLNHELESFASAVSHDLRQPLRGMAGYAQILMEDHTDILSDEGRDYLRRISASAVRMGTLIDDLLMLSRVTRGEMRRQPVDLTAMARDLVEELRAAEPGRSVDVRIQPGMAAEGDPALLRALLQNLIANAWKFSAGSSAPRIDVGFLEDDDTRVFYVRDNGVGFDMAHANKLFNAFQRLHGADEFPGTGIGLATVKRIVTRHGGTIWAQAEPGKGATFSFTLA